MPSVPMPLVTTPLLNSDDWYYRLKKNYETRAPVEDRWFSFTRGLRDKPHGESHKFDYLIEHFVDEITGPYDQDISLLLVGNKGRGKSICGISLCFYAACELAERLGGKWQDYFDPIRNLAVILEDEATALMAIQDKYQVKNYDDIGIGWSARSWQKSGNQEKNAVFQINRTDCTIQVFSVPNQFLLDKVPRSLVSHYAEMDQQFFAHGFTTVKMFKPETLFREGKIIQPYLAMDRTKYVLFRVPKPPQDLVEFYQKKRRENKTKATNSRFLDADDMTLGGEKIKKPLKKNATIRAMEQEMAKFSTQIMSVISSGGSDSDLVEVLIQQGLPKYRAKNWVKHQSFKEMYPRK